jgi:LuxR family transcriptional regulator of spore coat protein
VIINELSKPLALMKWNVPWTSEEQEMVKLLILNKSTREISEILDISEKTVRNHISNTMQKLGVKGRASAVVELLKLNEISL